MISSTRTKDARRIFSLAFLCLGWPLCSAAWAQNPRIELSGTPAVRALAVSGNQSPSLFVPPTIQVDEGSGLSIQVTATDPNPSDNLTLTLTSTLALGLTLNASVAPSLVIAMLKGSLGFSDAGTYNLLWSVSDGMNPPVTATTTLAVRSVAPPPQEPPISVFPKELLLDVRSNVVIKGENFGTSSWVELRGEKGTVSADTVVILSPTALVASVFVPASMESKYDVIVTGPAGYEQRLPLGIEASAYRIEAVDPVTGKRLVPIPRDQSSAPKAPYAPSLFPCEGANFCSGAGFVGILTGCEGEGVYPYFGISGQRYFVTYGGIKRRCWVSLHVRAKTVGGHGVPDPTGGHCHSDVNRPIGAPVDTAGYTSDGTSPEFDVVHRWPPAAGQLEGVLWSTDPNCPNGADSVNADFVYCIYNPAVILDPPQDWILRNSGPGDFPIGNPSQHPTNWAMIRPMAVALDSVSAEWRRKYPSGPQLGFNDASLPWGGVFDVDPPTNWTPPHCGHRAGVEMDHSSKNKAPLDGNQLQAAKRIFRNRGFIWAPEGDHIHVYYAGPGTYTGIGSPINKVVQRIKKGQ